MHWMPVSQGTVYHQINVASVGGWPNDYRIPDLVLLVPERFVIDRNEYFEGAPSAVVEIRSPRDETTDKLAFYAALGVPEVWVIDRDTKQPELYRLAVDRYEALVPGPDAWLASALGVEFRAPSTGRLQIRLIPDGPPPQA
jgi:Uma2 family endonuclease